MGKASRVKRRAIRPASRRARGSLAWYTAIGVIVVLGIGLIVLTKAERGEAARPRPNFDHWHAALGVKVCGKWLPNADEFHAAANDASLNAGVHSHGDGLIHIHPYTSAEGGDNATVGLFLEYGGWRVTEDSIDVWSDTSRRNGDECPNGEPGVVRWSVNGEERDGDPSGYKPADQDVIAIAFGPEDAKIGTPPQKEALKAPSDLEPGDTAADTTTTSAPPGPGGTTTAPPGAGGTTTAPADAGGTTTAPADAGATTTAPAGAGATTVPSTGPPPTSAP